LVKHQRNGFKTYPGAVFDISSDVASDGERGLLGIAFSTDARSLFLSYVNKKGEIVVASWNVSDPVPPPVTIPAPPAPGPTVPGAPTTTAAPTSTTTQVLPVIPAPVVDAGSKRTLLTIAREGTTNYSGQLTLGRDGFLYIGVGDSPNGGVEKAAQNPESLLGKILRIDPGGATLADPYAIPPGNPFAAGGESSADLVIGRAEPSPIQF